MDILRVLSTPDLEVRKKTLQLALDLVSSRNVEEVSQYRYLFPQKIVALGLEDNLNLNCSIVGGVI